MKLPRHAIFNGRLVAYPEAKVGVLTHALNYGTGCFAGLRAYWSTNEEQLFLFRPRDHFRRFLESARLLSMSLPYSEDDLVGQALTLLRAEDLHTDTYMRPLAFYADEMIGVRLHDLTPAVSMVAFPFGNYMENPDGAHLTVSSWTRIDDSMIPARGKITGSYVNSALARTDAQRAGFDDALLLNKQGHVSEASISNFFMVRHGEVVTPPVTDDILEGITRRTLIALLREDLGVSVVERSIDRSELFLAEEAFVAGTGVQIVPVTRLDHRPIGTGSAGRIALDLRRLYDDVVRGRVAKYRGWCRPVYVTEPAAVRATGAD
jgi:branched-chain amino acid aminotransferase